MGWMLKRQPRVTGWVDLTVDLMAGWSARSFRVMRTGDFVIIEAGELDGSSATSDGVVFLPPGFYAPIASFPFSTGIAATPVVHAFTNRSGGMSLPRSMPKTGGYAPARTVFPVVGIPWPRGY